MKKLFKVVVAVAAMLAVSACSRVESGYVGIKVNLLGSDKGVQQEVLGAGRYFIGMNEELYIFPTFQLNCAWTASETDGKGCSESLNDESIRFQTVEGLAVKADVGIAFTLDKDKVPELFQTFRKGVVEISDSYVRRVVQDAFITAASTKRIDFIYGEGKATLLKEVNTNVKATLKDKGINVENVFFLSDLIVPEAVTQAVNAKIQATQKAQQRENEVAQAKAEADKAREEAKGFADSQLIKARAEAESIKLRAAALRESADIATLNAIEKWDGKLPQYMGTQALPFLQQAVK